jgi:hypothetical protein
LKSVELASGRPENLLMLLASSHLIPNSYEESALGQEHGNQFMRSLHEYDVASRAPILEEEDPDVVLVMKDWRSRMLQAVAPWGLPHVAFSHGVPY